jgi:hypothetical protein
VYLSGKALFFENKNFDPNAASLAAPSNTLLPAMRQTCSTTPFRTLINSLSVTCDAALCLFASVGYLGAGRLERLS